MKRYQKMFLLLATGTLLLQFGGCVAGVLSDLFFAVGPLLL